MWSRLASTVRFEKFIISFNTAHTNHRNTTAYCAFNGLVLFKSEINFKLTSVNFNIAFQLLPGVDK